MGISAEAVAVAGGGEIGDFNDFFVLENLGLVGGILKQLDHLAVAESADDYESFGFGESR